MNILNNIVYQPTIESQDQIYMYKYNIFVKKLFIGKRKTKFKDERLKKWIIDKNNIFA